MSMVKTAHSKFSTAIEDGHLFVVDWNCFESCFEIAALSPGRNEPVLPTSKGSSGVSLFW